MSELLNKYLTEELNDYINLEKKCDGAFYVCGKWGTGKTTFIKNYIKENFDDFNNEGNSFSSPSIYVSLFGLTSMAQVENKSFFNVNKRNAVGCKLLVLDDFERCNLDIQELFSFINYNIEHGIRVILIGYEEEVKKRLSADKRFKENLILSILSNNKEKYDLEVKNNKKEKDQYDLIKEKTISRKYYFVFDSSIFFDSILNEYEEEIQVFVRKYQTLLESIIKKYQCTNFRTCKSALNTYIKIVSRINSTNKKILNLEIKKNILASSFIYTIQNNSETKYDVLEDSLFQLNNNFLLYSFVRKYVEYLIWDYKTAVSEIGGTKEQSSKRINKNTPQIISQLSASWSEKTDDELSKQIFALIDTIKEMILPVKYYPRALMFVSAFINYGFKSPIGMDELTNIMVENIKKSNEINIIDDDTTIYAPTASVKPYVDKLIKEIHNNDARITIEELVNLLKFNTKRSLQKIKDMRNNFVESRCFFSLINIEELFETIKNASASDIVFIRNAISQVYSFSNLQDFFPDDKQNVDKLINLIESYNFDDQKIKKMNIVWFIADLKKYSKQLANPSSNW